MNTASILREVVLRCGALEKPRFPGDDFRQGRFDCGERTFLVTVRTYADAEIMASDMSWRSQVVAQYGFRNEPIKITGFQGDRKVYDTDMVLLKLTGFE